MMDHMVTVCHKRSRGRVGFLDLQVAKALGCACERFGTVLDAYIPTSESKVTDRKAAQHLSTKVCIIVYGTLDHMDQVGKVLSDFEIYLQHPKHHDTSVPYNNPQYLLRPGGKPTYRDHREPLLRTHRRSNILAEYDPLKEQIDQVFDSMQGPREFSRVSVSHRLSTTLKKFVTLSHMDRNSTNVLSYQEKALSMMIEKESGMIEGNRFGSLWTVHTLPNGQTR
jgi:hypothetical protein